MRFYCLRNFVLSKPLRKITYKTTKIDILEMNNKKGILQSFFTFTMLENDSKTENNSPEKSFFVKQATIPVLQRMSWHDLLMLHTFH